MSAQKPSRSRRLGLTWILSFAIVLTLAGCGPQSGAREKTLPRSGAQWFIPGATDALPSPAGDRLALLRGPEVLVFDLFQPKRGTVSVGTLPFESTTTASWGCTSATMRSLSLPGEGTTILGWTLEDQGWAVVIVAGKKDPYAHEREYWLVSIDSPGVIRKLGEARWISWRFYGRSGIAVWADNVNESCLIYTDPTKSLSPDRVREVWRAPSGADLRYFRAITPSMAVAETYYSEMATQGHPFHELWSVDLETGNVTPIPTGSINVIDNWYPSPDGSKLALLGFSRGDPWGAVVSLGTDSEAYDLGPSDVCSEPRWAEDSSCFVYRSYDRGAGPLMLWKAMDRTPVPLPLFGFPLSGPDAQAAPLHGGRWLAWDGSRIGIVDEVEREANELAGPHYPGSVWVTAGGRVFGFGDKDGIRVMVISQR